MVRHAFRSASPGPSQEVLWHSRRYDVPNSVIRAARAGRAEPPCTSLQPVKALPASAMLIRRMSILSIHGAELRMAETRAVNRALRKAYAVPLCSAEEIGWFGVAPRANQNSTKIPAHPANGNGYGGRTVRGSPLPANSPAPARCNFGQVLRDRFLRSQDPAPSHTRAGREFPTRHRPTGPIKTARPPSRQSTAISARTGRGMRRQIAGLHAADPSCGIINFPHGTLPRSSAQIPPPSRPSAQTLLRCCSTHPGSPIFFRPYHFQPLPIATLRPGSLTGF